MALDFNAIRKVIIDSIKLSIGDQLSQTTNPVTTETYGMVFNARPNPELPIPEYPYAVVDILSSADVDWYLTNLRNDVDTGEWQYETHKSLEFQVTIFGGKAIQLAEQLKTSYRRDDVLEILLLGDLALADADTVLIQPELLQTDFLEVGVVKLTVRVNDVFIDPSLETIENVILDGTLEGTVSGDPLIINIDTTT